MYNMALMYVNQKSEDMAIIQLKKALETNPKFIEACNLLIVCYLMTGDKEQAKLLVKKVLDMDINNKKALTYQKILGKDVTKARTNHQQRSSMQEQQRTYKKVSKIDKKDHDFHVSEISSFVVGCLISLAVMFALVIPEMISAREQTINQLTTQKEMAEQEYNTEMTKKEEKISELETKNNELSEANDKLNEQVEIQERIQTIDTVNRLFNQGNIEDSASILYSFETDGFPEDVILEVEELKSKIYPQAGQRIFNSALAAYNARRYEEAKNLFEQSKRYPDDRLNRIDNIIYHQGLTAEALGEKELALEYYRQVVEEHRNSNRFNNSNTRIRTLERELGITN